MLWFFFEISKVNLVWINPQLHYYSEEMNMRKFLAVLALLAMFFVAGVGNSVADRGNSWGLSFGVPGGGGFYYGNSPYYGYSQGYNSPYSWDGSWNRGYRSSPYSSDRYYESSPGFYYSWED